MKTRIIASMAAVLFVASLVVPLTAHAKYQVPELLKQRLPSAAVEKAPAVEHLVRCPVSGMKADKSEFLTFKGQKIYFCCARCEEPFLKNPDAYLQKHGKTGSVENPRWRNPQPRS